MLKEIQALLHHIQNYVNYHHYGFEVANNLIKGNTFYSVFFKCLLDIFKKCSSVISGGKYNKYGLNDYLGLNVPPVTE